jgi:hypothetical protein
MCGDSTGVTSGSVREPGSLTLPFGVGCMVFSTKSKKPYTPLEWAGTRQRAVFAVRNQHTVQVKPVEGPCPHTPCGQQGLFKRYCPQSPALQSGKSLSLMGMGTRFPHAPLWRGVSVFCGYAAKNRNPTRMGWHAPSCVSCPFASGSSQRHTPPPYYFSVKISTPSQKCGTPCSRKYDARCI